MKWQGMARFGAYMGDLGGFGGRRPVSTDRVFVFNDFLGGGRVGGWHKRVKFVRFLADFDGVVAAEEDGLGKVWGS